MAHQDSFNNTITPSCLILSKDNSAWQGKDTPKGVPGSMTTAGTITRLDMKGIDPLFLPLCQMGNCKDTPEGVHSSQGAFKKASSKAIVTNLAVNDKAGKEFLVKFHKNLTKKGWNQGKTIEIANPTSEASKNTRCLPIRRASSRSIYLLVRL